MTLHEKKALHTVHIKRSWTLKNNKSFLLKMTFTFFRHLNSILWSGKWSLSLLACTSAFFELVDVIAPVVFFPRLFLLSQNFLVSYSATLEFLGFLLRLWFFISKVVKLDSIVDACFFFFALVLNCLIPRHCSKHPLGCEMETRLTTIFVCLLNFFSSLFA